MKRLALFFLMLLILFGFLRAGILYAMGGYSNEVHTSFAASPGYILDDSLYFLVNYELFRKPMGIYRFPDGGISKTVHQSLYLMQYSENRVQMVKELSSNYFSDSTVKAMKAVRIDLGLVLIMLPPRGSDEQLTFTVTQNAVLIEKMTVALVDSFEGQEAEKESISFTSNLIRKHGLGSAGLPSPLDYTHKRRHAYIQDLFDLKGDGFYRKEILRKMELTNAEIKKLLAKMEKRAQKRDGPQTNMYSLTEQDLINELKMKLIEGRK